jgi:4,5-DOPA dioxygenase extradiol
MEQPATTNTDSQRMPALFVGHGSPLNAISDNRFSQGFAALGALVPRPRAILAVSAHWYVVGTHLTGDESPQTIHDFYGFPPSLYDIVYPASGDVELAKTTAGLIGADRSAISHDWGLDHGTWSVLKWMYPKADIPVVQLSIDARMSVHEHMALAGRLAPLREEGVLVMGSGNITHNLADAMRRMSQGNGSTPSWSADFDASVVECLRARDTERLLTLWPGTDEGRLAHPTPDHWLPLIYTYAVTDVSDSLQFPVDGFDIGLSMRSVLFGAS